MVGVKNDDGSLPSRVTGSGRQQRASCASRGYHVGMVLYGEDRLRTPLLRNRTGQLVLISWDEAIAVVAQKIHAAPQKFAFMARGSGPFRKATPPINS